MRIFENMQTEPNWTTRPTKPTTRFSNLEKGKLIPQALELEEAVLGAILIDSRAVSLVIDILEEPSFYSRAHQIIYRTVRTLFTDSLPIDLITISAAIRKSGELQEIGGDSYLIKLSQKVNSSAHCEYHARIIVEKFIQRELIRIGGEIVEEAFDETTDVLELLDSSEAKLFEVTNGNIKKNYETSEALVRQAIKRIQEIGNKSGYSGIPSGFNAVDTVTSGWQPSDLVIIAARPGMGKTAFVLSMARNMAVTMERPVAFFSLEMSSVQLITRLISSETGINSETLRKGKLNDDEWQRLLAKVHPLEKAPLYIDDTPALSIFDLRAKCRRLVAEKKVEIIIIDYLQLMTANSSGKGGNREQEISAISRGLKSLAKELHVPVIALSQLSREVEKRPGKRPMLSDLRESGAIEQDADIVSFIYRPEYYKIEVWEDDTPSAGQAEFIIAKHRNGSLEDVRLSFEGHIARLSDLKFGANPGVQHQTVFESKMNIDNGFQGGNQHHSDFSSQNTFIPPPNDDEAPF